MRYESPLLRFIVNFMICDYLVPFSAAIITLIVQGDNESGQYSSTTPRRSSLPPSQILPRSSNEQITWTNTIISLVPSVDLQSLIISLVKPSHYDDNRHESVARMLSLATPSGRTLLHLSAALGFHELLRVLIAPGVDLNQCDKRGYTALHYAALYGHPECAVQLVEGGADSRASDRWECLAIELAEGPARTKLQDILGTNQCRQTPSGEYNCISCRRPCKLNDRPYSPR